jgi:hypothetical protein
MRGRDSFLYHALGSRELLMERYLIKSDRGPIMQFDSLAAARQAAKDWRINRVRDLYLIDQKTGERITP